MAENETTAIPPAKRVATSDPGALLGFGTQAAFEYTNRAAMALARSTLVPEAFRQWVVNKKSPDKELVENHSAVANCIIALNMSARLGADPLMIMQNLYIVEGRPSWSSQFVIACINASGRFSPLRFDLSEPSPTPTAVEYEVSYWENRQKKYRKMKVELRNRTCRAWVIEKATKERLDGPEISMEMAVAEGWFGKQGSKWQTMPEMMLRYRAAAFFGRLYAPDLLMGLHTEHEVIDGIFEEVPGDGAPALPPPMPVRSTYPSGAPMPEEQDGETVDPETGEVFTDGGGQGDDTAAGAGDTQQGGLGLTGGGPVARTKPTDYVVPVPTRAGADRRPQPDWAAWPKAVFEVMKSYTSPQDVERFREANQKTMTDLFRADPELAQQFVGEIGDRENELLIAQEQAGRA